MIEIEKFQDCNDINEASARERYWYELLNAKLNTNCPARNKKEYYKDNKDNVQKVNKEYREKNKDKIQKVNKEYREKNKDNINAMRKTPYICDICNGTYTYSHKSRHFNSQKHQITLNNNND